MKLTNVVRFAAHTSIGDSGGNSSSWSGTVYGSDLDFATTDWAVVAGTIGSAERNYERGVLLLATSVWMIV